MPLRRRLMVLISLVLVAASAAGMAMTYWQGLRKIDLEMTSAIGFADGALGEVKGHLANTADPLSEIRRAIQSFDGERHVQMRLIGSDGATIIASSIKPPANPAPQWFARLLTGTTLTRAIDLPTGLPLFGKLQVDTDPANELAETWEDFKLRFMLLSGFFALVLGLVSVTLGHALKPLEDLSAALAKVGQGDYAQHVIERGPKELAAIYRQFNRMTRQLAEAEQGNHRLNEQLLTVQEEERADIARDLHDEVGPYLFAIDVDAQTIPPLIGNAKTSDAIDRSFAIRQSVKHAQHHIRSLLNRLRPGSLVDLGLIYAVDQLVAFWQTRRPAIVIETEISDQRFDATTEETAFRILQEGTSNAIRHGKPARIVISAKPMGSRYLQVRITDDGSGLKSDGSKGFGLSGMRERVALIGGRLTIDNHTGRPGVTLTADLPLKPSTRTPGAA